MEWSQFYGACSYQKNMQEVATQSYNFEHTKNEKLSIVLNELREPGSGTGGAGVIRFARRTKQLRQVRICAARWQCVPPYSEYMFGIMFR